MSTKKTKKVKKVTLVNICSRRYFTESDRTFWNFPMICDYIIAYWSNLRSQNLHKRPDKGCLLTIPKYWLCLLCFTSVSSVVPFNFQSPHFHILLLFLFPFIPPPPPPPPSAASPAGSRHWAPASAPSLGAAMEGEEADPGPPPNPPT